MNREELNELVTGSGGRDAKRVLVLRWANVLKKWMPHTGGGHRGGQETASLVELTVVSPSPSRLFKQPVPGLS